MPTITLAIKTYKQEGDLAHEYNPLRNMVDIDNNIKEFNTKELNIDLNNPLNIECQPSYDGTVNLIINDDKNPPRIINTRFSKIEDNKYKIINRNQLQQTNLYNEGKIDQQTRLFRNINRIPKIDLISVNNMGQLMGGNYTFYVKFADNDYNKTDIVAESGQVSIFKGYLDKVDSISGTIVNERTDKAITLNLSNLDTTFSKFYLYYTRSTSDENGFRIVEAGEFTIPYEIKSTSATITINGYEETNVISEEQLNIKYNLVTAVKTQAQVQNMLFFGNIQGVNVDIKNLQNLSYFIKVSLEQENTTIGNLSTKDYSLPAGHNITQTEYYNPENIYYKLGYWPDEMYRLGIVYIMNDDSLSPVFNLRGHNFSKPGEMNYNPDSDNGKLYLNGEIHYLVRDEFLANEQYLDNTFGVFRNPDIEVIKNNGVFPLYYKMEFPEDVIAELHKYNVKGYFFVRQRRIPTSLCQGLSVGIDNSSYVPMLHNKTKNEYFTESFKDRDENLTLSYDGRIVSTNKKQCSGLLCLDANINPVLQSNFDGTEFIIKSNTTTEGDLEQDNRHYYVNNINNNSKYTINAGITFVPADSPLVYMNNCSYSTKCGAAEDVGQFSFFETRNMEPDAKLLRGQYCPFLGVSTSLKDNIVYTIKVPNYSESMIKEYFKIRGRNNTPFFAISDRFELPASKEISYNVYRGDCYSNTVTIRMNRNFIDSEVPISDIIIDNQTWRKNYKGYTKMVNTTEELEDDTRGNFIFINRADVNTVPLGHWVTFKCLSNYNLGLRSDDYSHTDEHALMGSVRSFYPHQNMSTVVSNKIEESWLLNDGYNNTLGVKRNFIVDNVPYIKELFDNRVMFSNVQRDDDFMNAYRIFQGLSYKDIDGQYGAIVKFISWGVNILCIFEHGIGIIPINEKALIQTNTGQSIHMYGAGVLQNQITLISPDFGSIWPESIIRTPIGVYGVDTYAKKIWRYSDGKGLETISDMKVQRFLNDYINLSESDKYPIIALRNVKSHYNNYKGDVMFTFYNDAKGTTWDLCFNERMDKWITKYSWTPLYSENINNIFYSLDQNRARVFSNIYNNLNCTYGLQITPKDGASSGTNANEWIVNDLDSIFEGQLKTVGYTLPDKFDYNITSIETSYLNDIDEEIPLLIEDSNIINQLFSVDKNIITSEEYEIFNKLFVKEGIEINERLHKSNTVPIWYRLNMTVTMYIGESTSSYKDVLGIVVNDNYCQKLNNKIYTQYRNVFLQNGFFVHGRAGIFDEIDYDDPDFDNQILPTKWYNKQEPFEFEFVVNDEVGLHKIYDNLVIISNNVQPEEVEYEIIGDVYNFNKSQLYRTQRKDWQTRMTQRGENLWSRGRNDTEYSKVVIPESPVGSRKKVEPDDWATSKFKGDFTKPRVINGKQYKSTQEFLNTSVKWDNVLNSYSLLLNQKCKNIEEFGRRLGNIHYKEDSWYITIDPIMYRERFKTGDNEEKEFEGEIKSVRLRDKFIKIRVKYTGEDLVIITALKTILTQSYA